MPMKSWAAANAGHLAKEKTPDYYSPYISIIGNFVFLEKMTLSIQYILNCFQFIPF